MSPAVKHDGGKPRLDLVPTEPVLDAAKVFAFGAGKYGERNWEQGLAYGRIYAALCRHVMAWWAGENIDPESGLGHLAHATCCILMLAATEDRVCNGALSATLDDRFSISTTGHDEDLVAIFRCNDDPTTDCVVRGGEEAPSGYVLHSLY